MADYQLNLERTPSGNRLGYKILPPDFDFSTGMSIYENYILEIKEEHDLNGISSNIHATTVLKFNGGCLKNGEIIINGMKIGSTGVISLDLIDGNRFLNIKSDVTIKGVGTSLSSSDIIRDVEITSDGVHTITISGRFTKNFVAKNCVFNRDLSSTYFDFISRDEYYKYVIMEDCHFYESDSGISSDEANTIVFTKDELVLTADYYSVMEIRRCSFTNIGLSGVSNGIIEHCNFYLGNNIKNNIEAIHCRSNTTVYKCTFYCGGVEGHSDIIDTYNFSNINIIECNFLDVYTELEQPAITIKSHYGDDGTKLDSDYPGIGAQYNVTVRDCKFEFKRKPSSIAILLWNNPRETILDVNRMYNRYATNIENNIVIVDNDKEVVFTVLGDTDTAHIINNKINLLTDTSRATLTSLFFGSNDASHAQLLFNIQVKGNIIRAYSASHVSTSSIIQGGLANQVISNLIVQDNILDTTGYIANISPSTTWRNIRICGNIFRSSYKDSVFNNYGFSTLTEQLDVVVTQNSVNGRCTDIGTTAQRPSGGLIGRGYQYFDTDLNSGSGKVIYYNSGHWRDAAGNLV